MKAHHAKCAGATSDPGCVMSGQFAVWYASAGCLPDAAEPEFVGTEIARKRYAGRSRGHNLHGMLEAF